MANKFQIWLMNQGYYRKEGSLVWWKADKRVDGSILAKKLDEWKSLEKIQHSTTNEANHVLAACKNAVQCSERMPTKAGFYKTNIGVCYLEEVLKGLGLKAGLSWQFGMTPEWWEE